MGEEDRWIKRARFEAFAENTVFLGKKWVFDYCESCGNFDLLRYRDGLYLCSNCRNLGATCATVDWSRVICDPGITKSKVKRLLLSVPDNDPLWVDEVLAWREEEEIKRKAKSK